MMNIGICDDSREVVDVLRAIIDGHLANHSKKYIITCYTSGIKLLEANIEFDIVFLDIEMSDLDGIEIARRLRKISLKTKIIYVTNYQKYQSYAFQVHAFQYILKPFSSDTVCSALDEALAYIQERNKKDTFSFYSNKGFVTVNASDIYYLEFRSRKIQVVCKTDNYVMNGTLSKLFEELKPYGFGMPHKSYIVNFQHVFNIKGYDIIMRNNAIVPMAQRKAVEFKSAFFEFLHGTYYLLK